MASNDTSNATTTSKTPIIAAEAVLKPSVPVTAGSRKVQGIEFNNFAGKDVTVNDLIAGMANMGFQATAVSEATRLINDMVRLSKRPTVLS